MDTVQILAVTTGVHEYSSVVYYYRYSHCHWACARKCKQSLQYEYRYSYSSPATVPVDLYFRVQKFSY
jgi:hypothetical protein